MREDIRLASRRVLCVFPKYSPSFGTFEYAYPLTNGVQAFMPPQGLLLIAASLPQNWDVRFIDENIAPASPDDFRWADAVFVSGMHIQRRQMNDICRRAHEHDLPVALGGPSVSACPENYPDFDYLHVGELGDATDDLFRRIANDPSRPESQIVLTTQERREMSEFPLPAYELIPLRKYFLGSIQFSSGCPYQCEFCDIPALYGRNPRLKTPEQVLAELDKMVACGLSGSVYFVDDNFIGNRRAALELLPHLVEWQKRNGFALHFACEATLNIAKRPEILTLMRDAYFTTVFCGIETPDPAALKAMSKQHNMVVPILEGVRTLNSYGLEVVSGIILGLDTDTMDSGEGILEFIDQSQIPLLTINLLQALPRTPLWDRLKRENRLNEDEDRDSNVEFFLPYDHVVATWRECMGRAYTPEKLFARFEHQVRETYCNRIAVPNSKQRLSWYNIKRALVMFSHIVWQVGVKSDYRREFWRFAWPRLKSGDIERILQVGLVAHHLILFARGASGGQQTASYYSARVPEMSVAAE
ncbi:radical SAM protein [Afipia sp. Root123D2]|uniref:B12-binding domain-containing radical SAM protein n=1 Tax=Afipia sp. Root123D2 TaxID=1736436 RepID=UPI0006F1F5CE|nr:B12-binding domain-containing radical SAM protein [Afipia sp. Root123D2]KQW18618.1 radical SAM protein [Afipia sp. Root123D2]